MKDAVIVSGARTPVGRFGGAFKDVSAPDLGSQAIKAALERAGITPDMVDEVVIGNAVQAAEAGYAARLASLKSGIPHDVPTIAINRQCSSGLEAINMAAQLIRTGEAEIAVAGGTENMSQVPYMIKYQARFDGLRMGNSTLVDGLTEGLGCPVNRYHMGVTAENVAERFGVSRKDQDELAFISHQRASTAASEGRFTNQITEIEVQQRRSDPVTVSEDEGPRADTTIESLSVLRPVFKKDGTVTAGNASSINDGAAALLLCNQEKSDELGLKPLLRWLGSASAGTDPRYFGYGPVPATEKLLKRFNLEIEDIGLIELNEAFAAQTIGCMRRLQISHDNTNVNGGAIALGHPTGCSGARILVTLMHEMKRRAAHMQRPFYGLATLCVGVGMGESTLVEWIGD